MKDSSSTQLSDSVSLDAYGDPKTIARILTSFIFLALVGISAGVVMRFVVNDGFGAILRIIYMLPILASLYFVRRNRIEASATMLAFVLLTMITIVATYGEGIHEVGVVAYPSVLIFASLVIRKRILALLTAYGVACVAWLIFGETHQWYIPANSIRVSIVDFFIFALVLVFTGFMVRLLTEALFRNNLRLKRELLERKKIEEQREELIRELEERNAELTQFTYTVSHDLKSPLVTIKGFLGYLETDAVSGNFDRLKSDIGRIADAVGKMQNLLNDILELSRIGRLINPLENAPFGEIVQDAMKLVPERFDGRLVVFSLQKKLPIVHVDRPRMVVALQNLMDNAIKFMGDQPEPRLEIGQRGEEDGKPVFFVKDNGIGISPEHHERVFGLFNRLNPDINGTGVGLSLVKRIIEFHNGRIWVESELGKGSTFLFTLRQEPAN